MRKRNYIIIGVLTFVLIVALGVWYFLLLGGLSGMGSPTGGRGPDYPYFITTESMVVKKIVLPKGTKLTYEEQFFKEGQQDRIMNEKKLTSIELPKGKTIDWGGVPVYMIIKFFNSEMKGFSVYSDFSQLKDDKKTKFSEIWQSCGSDLGVLIKNQDDWTFNTKNIANVLDCSVNFQRYFKEDTPQQQLLDKLYNESKKVGQKPNEVKKEQKK